jgi:hypothetical protein
VIGTSSSEENQVRKKILAALLPVVAFAALALSPALAQAANVTLKHGKTTVPVESTLKFHSQNTIFNLIPAFNVWAGCAVEELTGKVMTNPGATIEITGSRFESASGGPCPWYSQGHFFQPTVSSGHMLKMHKEGEVGFVEFNEVPTHFDFYSTEGEKVVKSAECNTLLHSEGGFKVETSGFHLEGDYLVTGGGFGECGTEFPTEGDFSITYPDGTPVTTN